jgi:hypothetical protein
MKNLEICGGKLNMTAFSRVFPLDRLQANVKQGKKIGQRISLANNRAPGSLCMQPPAVYSAI